LGPVAEISPKIAVAKSQFLVLTSQTIHALIYRQKKNPQKTEQNKTKPKGIISIKFNISQFWEGIKISCAPSDFDFVVSLFIQ